MMSRCLSLCFSGRWLAIATVVLGVSLLALSGCSGTTSHAWVVPTSTALFAGDTTPTTLPTLPIDCPHPDQPALASGAQLALQPESGPVGTLVTVEARGIQPGCHLFLGISVQPSLSETNGTPSTAPNLADSAIQWVPVSATGTIHTTFCVCQSMPTYFVGYPPYPSITPLPHSGATNVSGYAPKFGDYFFITIAGANIPNPPPLYARFTVTQ